MGVCLSTNGSQRDCGFCCGNGEEVSSSPPSSSSSCCRIKRKRSRRMLLDRAMTLQQLSSIPNRVFANGKGRTCCVFTQQGRKGVNQDAMIVWEDFMAENVTFCGVFDGHGPHGHLVARKVRDALPLKLLPFLNSDQIKKQAELDTTGDHGRGRDVFVEDKLSPLWREAFLKSYKAMDKELKSHPNLDCFCSGSTAVTIVKQGSNLFMGNIGDSRAIMGSKGIDDSLVAIQLTVDLKPDLPREAERIKRCKGRVFALQDEPEVPRVWLPFDDAPGLAMARAFGDFCLKEYGVISVPEFTHRVLTDRDQFIVLASDGVWDVLSNEEVVEIVSSAPCRSSAARIVVESAAREWKLKYATSKMDDCAVVCLFLDGKMDSESDNDEKLQQGISSAAMVPSNHSVAPPLEPPQGPEPTLERNFTVRSSDENNSLRRIPVEVVGVQEAAVTAEEQNWSGLEGVTRVNSLVQLPRFTGERTNA
ncbi:Probable protein phosphatase 2C 1 [Dionaea muscipula]